MVFTVALGFPKGNRDMTEKLTWSKSWVLISKLMTASQIEKVQMLASECVAKDYKGCWVEFYENTLTDIYCAV